LPILLNSRTGTEEQQTERGQLLKEIETVVAESESTINIETGAVDETDELLEYGQLMLAEDVEILLETPPKSKMVAERTNTDKERSAVLTASRAGQSCCFFDRI